MYQKWGKRMFDVVIAALMLLLLSPVLILVALLVRLTLGAPVLFMQERPGLKGEIFKLYKFRTMKEARDAQNVMKSDAERSHPVGRVLRSLSLDELPELYNVLKGDMSLVGPRPLLVEYLPHYSPQQQHRHDARPGLTGWAQVNGRNTLSWESKFEHDVWYTQNISFMLDIKILIKTVFAVILRHGINENGQVTVSRFDTLNSGTGSGNKGG